MRPLVALLLAGCVQPLAPHFAETAEVLQQGKLKLTVAGGGFGARERYGGGAGALRLREGIGHRMELGAEAYFALFDKPTSNTWGAKLSWKFAPIRQAALIVSVGAMDWSGMPAFAGDLGLVVSPAPARWRVQPYAGLRATVTQLAPSRQPANCVPTGPRTCDQQYTYVGPTVMVLLALGAEVRLTRRISLLLEGAPFWDWNWGHDEGQPWQVSSGSATPRGGYGAGALAVRFE